MKTAINLAKEILDNLKSNKIEKCFRLFYDDDFESLPRKYKFLQKDGNIYMKFSENKTLAFYPYTVKFTIFVEM